MLIKSQQAQNTNDCTDDNLETDKKTTYTPAYKESLAPNSLARPTIAEDLAELLDKWPELPEPIRQAILTLVRASEQYTRT